MSPRNQFLLTIALLLLIVSIGLFTFQTREQEPLQVFPATVDRDCAPWDGAAFTVSIPLEEAMIKISIYQSPDIRRATVFSFPDETLQEGAAMLLLPADVPEQLSGRVSFPRVEQGRPVEGKFDLAAGTGQRFEGMFIAEWGNAVVYCG